MEYSHLTKEERYQIQILKATGHTNRYIANYLRRSPATISRELRRNGSKKTYKANEAQAKAAKRAKNSVNGPRISNQAKDTIDVLLRRYWSPEQIAGRLKLLGLDTASHESIYKHVYNDKRGGGDLHKFLRSQKSRRKRRGAGNKRRGVIPNRVSIDDRPDIVAERNRIGDWEGDLIIGHGHKQALVTLVERVSKVLAMKKVPTKGSIIVRDAIIVKLEPFGAQAKTLTLDNGREFTRHEDIKKALGIDVFFAHPYSSYERGLNENTNGLIRQYFPKKKKFSQITDLEVLFVEEMLNNRPRKTLNFQTPLEVFNRLVLQSQNATLQS